MTHAELKGLTEGDRSSQQLISVRPEHVPQLSKRLEVPDYLQGEHRSLFTTSVMIFGASSIARSVLCPLMATACEHAGFHYGVCVVSTRRPEVVNDLLKQGGLYVAVETGPQGMTATLNGVIQEAWYAGTKHTPEGQKPDPQHLVHTLNRLSSPETTIVFLTITKAGYNLQSSVKLDDNDFTNLPVNKWLDVANAEINDDLRKPEAPHTPLGILVAGLRLRRAAGIQNLTVIPCENLPRSGQVAKKVVLAFAAEQDRMLAEQNQLSIAEQENPLAEWIDHNVDFIDAVVDRITLQDRLEETRAWLATQGVRAARPVSSELYLRLLLSNNWRHGVPSGWEAAGIKFLGQQDLEAWRQVKQQLLNGGHVIAGYIGSMIGLQFVYEAVRHEALGTLLAEFMREMEPSLCGAPGFEMEAFIAETLNRFDNSQLADPLARVGRNRNDKVQRLLLQPAAKIVVGGAVVGRAILVAIACWILSRTAQAEDLSLKEIFRKDEKSEQATEIREFCQSMVEAARGDNCQLFGAVIQSRDFFPKALCEDEQFLRALCAAVHCLVVSVDSSGIKEGVNAFLRPLH